MSRKINVASNNSVVMLRYGIIAAIALIFGAFLILHFTQPSYVSAEDGNSNGECVFDTDNDLVCDDVDNCTNQACVARKLPLPGELNCHVFDSNPTLCDLAYISGGKEGNLDRITPCYFGHNWQDSPGDSPSCNGCGPNNIRAGLCNVACEGAKRCPGNINVSSIAEAHCLDLPLDICEDYYMVNNWGYVVSCFVGERDSEIACRGCGLHGIFEEDCHNECTSNIDQSDTDADGVGDICDPCPGSGDQDLDGICDAEDNCPEVPNVRQRDTDDDGVGNACDNCANQMCNNQQYTDSCNDIVDPTLCGKSFTSYDNDIVSCFYNEHLYENGIVINGPIDNGVNGNVCHPCTDFNEGELQVCQNSCEPVRTCGDKYEVNHCQPNNSSAEECEQYYQVTPGGRALSCAYDQGNCFPCRNPWQQGCQNTCSANPDQADDDQDGIGNVCDADRDGDDHDSDNCPSIYNPGQEDGDSDGIGDVCDFCPDEYNYGEITKMLLPIEGYYTQENPRDPDPGEVWCVEFCKAEALPEQFDECLFEECQHARFIDCICGDGYLMPLYEQCDDGNRISGDGCNVICEAEDEGYIEYSLFDPPPFFSWEYLCLKDFPNEGSIHPDLIDIEGHAITAGFPNPAHLLVFDIDTADVPRGVVDGLTLIEEGTTNSDDTLVVYIFDYNSNSWTRAGINHNSPNDGTIIRPFPVGPRRFIGPEGRIYVKVISGGTMLSNDWTRIRLRLGLVGQYLSCYEGFRFNTNINSDGNLIIYDDQGDPIAELPPVTDVGELYTFYNDGLDGFGYTSIRGIILPEGQTKTLYVDNVSNGGAVCIIDSEIVSVTEIMNAASGCTGTTIVCPGVQGSYTCSVEPDGRYKITGLTHSGVLEVSSYGGSTGGDAGFAAIYSTNFWVNDHAKTTDTREVMLYFDADGAKEMIISNDPTFHGAEWEPYRTKKAWTLSEGAGPKFVYAIFRNNAAKSTIVSYPIILEEPKLTSTLGIIIGLFLLGLSFAGGFLFRQKNKNQ